MKKRMSNEEVKRKALIAGASFAGALFTFEALDRVWNYNVGSRVSAIAKGIQDYTSPSVTGRGALGDFLFAENPTLGSINRWFKRRMD